MNKFLKVCILISAILVCASFSSVLAVEADVQINGEIVDFTDASGNKVNAQIINSRTMVPLRKIFEVLGCEIDWNDETRTVIATKANREITLQINNNKAIKQENGSKQEITLDVAPVIVNNRTLVPLRFIAEALDKQVGWDSYSYTAVIIDYDYFASQIKQKNSNLYSILASDETSNNANYTFNITRNYIDKENAALNNTATIKGSIAKQASSANVNLTFEGNNELITDIIKEGWNNFSYEVQYTNNSMMIKTQNNAINKMLNLNSNEFNEIQGINLSGSVEEDISGAIRSLFHIDDIKLNATTFAKMKSDFEKFNTLFVANGTKNLNENNAKLGVLDYTRFDNIIYNHEVIKTLSFVNQKIFNYDINQDELLYDWQAITYTINAENNNLVLKIALENEYNERVEYTINIQKSY